MACADIKFDKTFIMSYSKYGDDGSEKFDEIRKKFICNSYFNKYGKFPSSEYIDTFNTKFALHIFSAITKKYSFFFPQELEAKKTKERKKYNLSDFMKSSFAKSKGHKIKRPTVCSDMQTYLKLYEISIIDFSTICVSDIDKKWRLLSLKHHPDKNNNSEESYLLILFVNAGRDYLSKHLEQ